MRRKSFILFFFLLAFLFQREPVYPEAAPPHRTLLFPSGTKIDAEVADTTERRSRGLMFRDRLPAGGGMLFIFEQAQPYLFWMKNCKFPIDIIWLNGQKEIVFISENTPPCKADPCPNYGPEDKASLYVIEVAAGFSKKERLKLGAKVRF